jgi:hypothetical protein
MGELELARPADTPPEKVMKISRPMPANTEPTRRRRARHGSTRRLWKDEDAREPPLDHGIELIDHRLGSFQPWLSLNKAIEQLEESKVVGLSPVARLHRHLRLARTALNVGHCIPRTIVVVKSLRVTKSSAGAMGRSRQQPNCVARQAFVCMLPPSDRTISTDPPFTRPSELTFRLGRKVIPCLKTAFV